MARTATKIACTSRRRKIAAPVYKEQELSLSAFLRRASAPGRYESNLAGIRQAVYCVQGVNSKQTALVIIGPEASGKTLLQEFMWNVAGRCRDRLSVHAMNEPPTFGQTRGMQVLLVFLRRCPERITIESVATRRRASRLQERDVASMVKVEFERA